MLITSSCFLFKTIQKIIVGFPEIFKLTKKKKKKKKRISLNYFITKLKLLPSCMFHWVESVYMLSTNLSREKLLTYNGKRKIHAHQILASK